MMTRKRAQGTVLNRPAKKSRVENHWDKLPTEIIDLISDFLPDPAFNSFRTTCKTIRDSLAWKNVIRSRTLIGCATDGFLFGVRHWCKINENLSRDDFATLCPSGSSIFSNTLAGKERWRELIRYGEVPAGLYLRCLITAAAYGNLNIVKYFVETYPGIVDPSGLNNEAVGSAILNGHVHVADFLFSQPRVREYMEYLPRKFLEDVCIRGHFQMVRYLVVNFAMNDECLEHALETACYFGNMQILTFLAALPRSYDYGLGFDLACMNSKLDVMSYLAPFMLEVEMNMAFVEANKLKVIKHMVSNPEFRIETASYGAMAVISAAQRGNVGIVKYLLTLEEYNTSVYGSTVVAASENGKLAVVRFLFTGNRSLRCPSSVSKSRSFPGVKDQSCIKEAFEKASSNGHLNIVRYLYKIPGIQITNEILLKAIELAVIGKHVTVTRFLVRIMETKKIYVPKDSMNYFVKECSKSGNVQILQILFGLSSAANDPDHRKCALVYACIWSQLEILRYLAEEVKTVDGRETWALDISMEDIVYSCGMNSSVDILKYLCTMKNPDGTDRIDISYNHHELLVQCFRWHDVTKIRYLLSLFSGKKHPQDFIVTFIEKCMNIHQFHYPELWNLQSYTFGTLWKRLLASKSKKHTLALFTAARKYLKKVPSHREQ